MGAVRADLGGGALGQPGSNRGPLLKQERINKKAARDNREEVWEARLGGASGALSCHIAGRRRPPRRQNGRPRGHMTGRRGALGCGAPAAPPFDSSDWPLHWRRPRPCVCTRLGKGKHLGTSLMAMGALLEGTQSGAAARQALGGGRQTARLPSRPAASAAAAPVAGRGRGGYACPGGDEWALMGSKNTRAYKVAAWRGPWRISAGPGMARARSEDLMGWGVVCNHW